VTAVEPATIMLAGDDASDGALIARLLGDEFGEVMVRTDGDGGVADFDQCRPSVLLLAFHQLQRAEEHYLRLLRLSQTIHDHPHQTIVLCDRQEVQQAYRLCRREIIDDYVVFWPVGNDAPRLSLAVYHALRVLQLRDERSAEQLTGPARVLGELAPVLEQQLHRGSGFVDGAGHAVGKAEQDLRAAIDTLLQGLKPTGGGDADELSSRVRSQLEQLRDERVRQHLQSIDDAVQPLRAWAKDLEESCAPHLQAAAHAAALSQRLRPTIMVIDDDPTMRRTVGTILDGEGYQIAYCASAIEGLRALRRLRPDLILLDVSMPGMDGLTVLKVLKSSATNKSIPVVMFTGRREQGIVLRCLQAGAADFVVKPFERARLVERVRLNLQRGANLPPDA
jgi:CheY-like chemotaxis protein